MSHTSAESGVKVTSGFSTTTNPKIWPHKISMVKVVTERSNVKSRSPHDVTHIHSPTNVPIMYLLLIIYSFSDTARTRFQRSRSHHDLAHLQSLTNVHTKHKHLDLTDSGQGHYSKVKGQIIISPATSLNQCPYQVSTSNTLWFM